MSERLLNCPFCGSKPDVDTHYVGHVESDPYTAVMCLTSGCPASYYHVALTVWNRRATPPLPDDVAGLIEEARKACRCLRLEVHQLVADDVERKVEAVIAIVESISRERAVLVEGFRVVHQWFPRKVADITEQEDAAVRAALALIEGENGEK